MPTVFIRKNGTFSRPTLDKAAPPRHQCAVFYAEWPLWLWSLLCVAGLAIGMSLHLYLHPRRQDLSDALDLLKNQPRLVLLTGLAFWLNFVLASDGLDPLRADSELPWSQWRQIAPWLLQESVTHLAMLFHQVLPAWPLALLLPIGIARAMWNLSRHPYRSGLRTRPRRPEWLLLSLLLLVTAAVTITEATVRHTDLPESVETLLLAARLLSLAGFTAASQVWLLRLICRWLSPPQVETTPLVRLAWWDILGRWRLLLALVAFDAAWIALRSWIHLHPAPTADVVFVETLFFFAPLPTAVALLPPGSSFLAAGALTLSLLKRALPSLILLSLTSLVILALSLHAAGLFGSLLSVDSWFRLPFIVLRAFVLAFVHVWLFLALSIALMRSLPATSPLSPFPNRPSESE